MLSNTEGAMAKARAPGRLNANFFTALQDARDRAIENERVDKKMFYSSSVAVLRQMMKDEFKVDWTVLKPKPVYFSWFANESSLQSYLSGGNSWDKAMCIVLMHFQYNDDTPIQPFFEQAVMKTEQDVVRFMNHMMFHNTKLPGLFNAGEHISSAVRALYQHITKGISATKVLDSLLGALENYKVGNATLMPDVVVIPTETAILNQAQL